MTIFLQNAAWAAAFGCFLFAAHLVGARRASPLPARILLANFLLYGVQAALLGARFGGWLPAALAPLRPTLAMTLGPLLFLYFDSAARPAFRLRPRDLLHFAPAGMIGAEFFARAFPVSIDLAIFTSFATYAAALALGVRRGSSRFHHLGDGEAKAFRLLVAGAMLLALSFVGEVAVYLDLVRGAPISSSPALLAILIAELSVIALSLVAVSRHPSPFDWMYVFAGEGDGGGAGRAFAFSLEERRACAASFDRLVASDRIWLQEGTSLAAVAGRLERSPRLLSEAINSMHGESFSRHLNRLRVEEAKRLLGGDRGLPVIAAMFDSGFRTKSSFNREFRAFTGMSPTAWREMLS